MDLPPPHQQPPFPPFPNSTTTIPSFAAHSGFPLAFSAPIANTTTPFSVPIEAQNHVFQTQPLFANPNPPTTTTQPHPSYPEMIFSAIEALKERDGSSKIAIAKYIERLYPNLPATHPTLLTQHLKALKNSGQLAMVKKSYMISRSDFSATTSLPETITTATTLPAPPPGSGRSRGRPPKPKPIPQPTDTFLAFPSQSTTIQGFTQASAQPTNVQAYIQPTNSQAMTHPIAQPNAQPVLVALGLVDDPNNQSLSKKRPGRPRKFVGVGVPENGSGIKRGRGRPPGSKGQTRFPKKSLGRPRKPKSVSTVMGTKRGRGRPSKAEPKTMIMPQYDTNMPLVSVDPNSNVGAVVQQHSFLRPRGRPRKIVGSTVGGAGGGLLSGKRRGRPAKVAGGIVKPKRRRGRPVGRPRKNAPEPLSEASHQLLAANEDLKRQLDYFQSKIKEAVGMLKPYVTHESEVNAIAAIQELEELATMGTSALRSDEAPTAQPPPQQAEQPQTDELVQIQS